MRRHLPTFTSLLCFESSARHLNFTRAAEELNLTQSAVSRQVRNLEEFVQTELFYRVRKRLVLTEEGQRYAESISDHLNALEKDTLRLITNDLNDSRLNIGTFPTFGSRWLIPKLNDFTRQNPGVQFNLTTGLAPFDFKSQDIDVAIQHGDGNWTDVVSQKLVDEIVVAVCTPELLATQPISLPADILNHTLLNLQTRLYAWPEWLEAHHVNHKGSVNGPVFENFSMMIRAALSGLGVAIIPQMYVEDELKTGKLVLSCGTPIRSQRGYYLVTTSKKRNLDRVQRFMNWIEKKALEAL